MGEDVVYCLNKVPVVQGNTRVVVDIRAVEGHLSLNPVTARAVVDIRSVVAIRAVEGHLSINRVTTRAVVDIRAVEAQLHSILVGHLRFNHVVTRAVEVHLHSILVVDQLSTRGVVVHAPEGECLSHTAGMGEVVLDQVFLQVHRDQFPSCTKPQMSNIKPLWRYHHPHRELAHPRSLQRPR
jgi:hypothetical protein